jgi:hypothetical protein
MNVRYPTYRDCRGRAQHVGFAGPLFGREPIGADYDEGDG